MKRLNLTLKLQDEQRNFISKSKHLDYSNEKEDCEVSRNIQNPELFNINFIMLCFGWILQSPAFFNPNPIFVSKKLCEHCWPYFMSTIKRLEIEQGEDKHYSVNSTISHRDLVTF